MSVAGTLLACSGIARAYNPPGGDNPSVAATKPDFNETARTFDGGFREPNTHGVILLRGIDILAGDGHQAISDYLWRYRRDLMNGMRQADEIAGYFQVGATIIPGIWEPKIGKPIPLDTNCHFYNAATGLGLQLLFNDFNFAVDLARALSIARWEFMTMLGPHAAATDMCNWAYARAVDAMRRGQTREAMTWLGWALHYLGDVTVPQHSTDYAATRPGANHTEYENACDGFIRDGLVTHPTKGGIYNTGWRPDQFVDYAARQSAPLINSAKVEQLWDTSARQMIPLAERLSAGLMHRFMALWRNEQFTVVVATVERARALSGYRHVIAGAVRDPTRDVDTEGEADFYARVGIDGRVFQSGVVDGGDDINPNKLSVHNWFFAKWISGRRTEVPMSVSLYDKDGGLNGGDDHCDINGMGNKKTLDFTYSLSDSRIRGDISGAAHPLVVTSNGVVGGDSTGGEWPKAEVRFRLERYPSLYSAPSSYIRGRVLRKGQPAKGVYVFYRDALVADARWQVADVDASGGYRISGLGTANRIHLRPAGTSADFLSVPKILDLAPGENVCDFSVHVSPFQGVLSHEAKNSVAATILGRGGTRGAKAPTQRDRQLGSSRLKSSSLFTKVYTPAKESAITKLIFSDIAKKNPVVAGAEQGYKETEEYVYKQLLEVQTPWNEFGVLGNGLGYATEGMVYVRLKSWVDDAGAPIPLFSTVYGEGPRKSKLPLGTGQYKEVTLYNAVGKPGPGVSGAKLQARLILGNATTGFSQAANAEGVTDSEGGVAFYFRAGTHVAEAHVEVNVVSNPVNSWARPTRAGQSQLFYPAKSGDDARAFVGYQLRGLPFDFPPGIIADTFRFRLDYHQLIRKSP